MKPKANCISRQTRKNLRQLSVVLFALAIMLCCEIHAGTNAPTPVKKQPSYVPPTAELLKRLAPAVVKIVVKLHGVPLTTGAGFFVSDDGVVITSRRLVRSALGELPMELEFVTTEKKALRDYKVMLCDPIEGSDLCSFKLSFEPKAFFNLIPGNANDGEPVSVIGHPRGMDFSITRGTIGQKNDRLISDAPANVGNQGGPAFDDNGHLVGIASHDSSFLPAREIISHLNSEKLPLSLIDTRRFAKAQLTKLMQKRTSEEFSPALAFAARGKPLNELKGFRDVALRFDDKILRLTLPTIFAPCLLTQTSQLGVGHTCSALDDAAVLSIRRISAKGHERLLEKNRKKIFESRAVDLVKDYQHSDEWDTYETVLTTQERQQFYSDPGLAQCQSTRTLTDKNAAFSDAGACRFVVRNDSEVGSVSINVWLLKKQHLYEVSIWVNNPVLGDYFSNVPTLAVLTARWEKSLDSPTNIRTMASDRVTVKPVPVYHVELTNKVGFMGTKIVEKKPQIDLYGKPRLLDSFEEGFVIGVTQISHQYLPPDFDEVTRRSATEVSRALSTTIQGGTIETESLTVAGKPARLLTAFGKNKATANAAILSATVFFDEQTYVITQIADSKDPGEAYREFKALLAGFKLK